MRKLEVMLVHRGSGVYCTAGAVPGLLGYCHSWLDMSHACLSAISIHNCNGSMHPIYLYALPNNHLVHFSIVVDVSFILLSKHNVSHDGEERNGHVRFRFFRKMPRYEYFTRFVW